MFHLTATGCGKCSAQNQIQFLQSECFVTTLQNKKRKQKKKVTGLCKEFFKMSQLVKPSNYTSITASCSND